VRTPHTGRRERDLVSFSGDHPMPDVQQQVVAPLAADYMVRASMVARDAADADALSQLPRAQLASSRRLDGGRRPHDPARCEHDRPRLTNPTDRRRTDVTDQERQKAEELISRLELSLGQVFPRDGGNAALITGMIQALNGLRSVLGIVRPH
jgi:hypothetical protein